jgi:hypothetical protein
VSGLILASIVGFLLGVLLMIFLITGREEEELLNRVEKVELSRMGLPRESGGGQEPVSKEQEKGGSTDRV